MILTAEDLRYLVIKETLCYLNEWTLAKENLLVGTAAQESGVGGWHQGKRVGLYRITPARHQAVWDKYLIHHAHIASEIRGLAGQHSFLKDPHAELITNLKYATAIAWMIYRQAEQPLPDAGDIRGLGANWLRYFHPRYSGSKDDFVASYTLLVEDRPKAAA
ncbi:hypothetical protein [Porticoccus sp.]|uniref:hypothetical protein n=1 Tax=Porticoccus sp. TaxID=2024853 RepID=UPI003F6A1794